MEIMYIILFFIIGTYMGSFYTVVGLRLPKNEPFLISRSKCDHCKHELSLLEMVPILSYFLLGRRCRHCKNCIDPLSTYIEFFTGILFAVAYYSFSLTPELMIALGAISLLIIVLVTDLMYLIIPDEILIFFSVYFIIFQLINVGLKNTSAHNLAFIFNISLILNISLIVNSLVPLNFFVSVL